MFQLNLKKSFANVLGCINVHMVCVYVYSLVEDEVKQVELHYMQSCLLHLMLKKTNDVVKMSTSSLSNQATTLFLFMMESTERHSL